MATLHTRRQALSTGAGALAGLLLAGRPGAACATAPAPAASLGALAGRLEGALVRPADAGWDAAVQLWNPAVQRAPQAVAQCASADDVAEVLAFAVAGEVPVAPRGGRHSFAGWSNAPDGIVCDLAALDALSVDDAAGTVTVGAGLQGIDLHEQLVVARGAYVPFGTCPTVGVAGLTLGGGVSRAARAVGVLSDSLLAAEVVLPDGRVVRCDEQHDADLLWALRGGGGGSFGVVTALTFRLRPTHDLLAWTASFDWAQAPAALAAWQATLPDAPEALSYARLRLLRHGDGSLTATAGGHWTGTEADLRALLAPLEAAGARSLSVRASSFADAWLPDGTTRRADGTYAVEVVRRPNYQRSQYVREPLPEAAIAQLCADVARWPGSSASYEGGVQLDCLGPGSAVNAVAAGATAFVHRDSRFHVAWLNFWDATDAPAVGDACRAWVRGATAALEPHAAGESYQNYIDPELPGWERAYYGSNLERLRAVKAAYDPDDVLAFAQGIRPAA